VTVKGDLTLTLTERQRELLLALLDEHRVALLHLERLFPTANIRDAWAGPSPPTRWRRPPARRGDRAQSITQRG
jgi:hypothetical protein